MESKEERKPKTLYHYCSTETFLSIMSSQSIWLSDVGKSNDKKEMSVLRKYFYDYIYNKMLSLSSGIEKECCRFLLATVKSDGFDKSTDILNREDLAKQFIDRYKQTRAYCFCLSEQKDSLGQWRGYADNGNGMSIGFSRKYIERLNTRSVFCPVSNFHLWSVSYNNQPKDLDEICKIIYDTTEKDAPPRFLINVLDKLFYFSTIVKDKSFKEEKEWRVIFESNDSYAKKELLDFSLFSKVADENYHAWFEIPQFKYTTRIDDIVSHIEVGIKDMRSAINSIIIGPKSKLTEMDIKILLISKGIIDNMKDKSILIKKSEASYR